MGKKYDELHEKNVNNTLDILTTMLGIGIEFVKVDNAMKKIIADLDKISEIAMKLAEIDGEDEKETFIQKR